MARLIGEHDEEESRVTTAPLCPHTRARRLHLRARAQATLNARARDPTLSRRAATFSFDYTSIRATDAPEPCVLRYVVLQFSYVMLTGAFDVK